jgi:prolyl oligopeptidase
VGKLYYRAGWNGEEKLLLDPGTYKPGVVTTIQRIAPSPDGRHVALALSSGGAEWSEVRILDVDSASLLPGSTYPSFGPAAWTLDSKAVFYDAGPVTDTRSPDIQLNRETRLHALGEDFAADRAVFGAKASPGIGIQPKDLPVAYVDESYPGYVFGYLESGDQDQSIFYAPISELPKPAIAWSPLCVPDDHLVRGMEFYGDYAYSVTHEGSPRYRLVRTSIRHPDWKHAETVIPEAADSIDSIHKARNLLFIVYSNGIVGRIVQLNLDTGAVSRVALPGSGTVEISCPDYQSNRCIVYLTSWTQPTTLFDYDGDKGTLVKSIFNSDVTYPGFDTLVTDEVEAPGHDGVMIPLSIIHRKDMPLDGSNCCILEGYGAYGYSYTPAFSVRRSVALHGVVVAYAHVRGGSEKGEAWYKGGFKATKPNTWKDFISCAEYLVAKGYTSPSRLGAVGTSAGGILVTRAITDRPDLFAAAICNVGCANAMRSEFSANGLVNTPEFGTVKDPVECLELYEMDGVQHVRPGVRYPAVLGVAGWSDRRVPPWEPGKFVATVQNATASGKPVLLKVNYDNGHFTEDKSVTFRNFAAQFSFLLWQEGHKEFQPAK